MIEDLGVRLRADGVVEATNGVNLTGKAIEDLGKKADAAAPAIARTGKTTKETAAAMRLLPAQITDITTSLASGQPAWLVAIQQGGQIKDSFGGIGPTFTALRGAIAPMALAFTGAAVAVGTLVAAYVAGSREADGYTRALVLSGNAAGVTRGQVADMARAVGASVGTQHQAAEAITQLIATGQVGSRGLQQFSETAIRMNRLTGQSVEDTVKTFADLARAPLQASIRLNESMNYLTSATYNHIRSLVEQKKMTEAAEVAQKAYSDAMNPRLATLESNLGLLQRGWQALGDKASETWDKMLGIGREQTLQQKLDEVSARIAKLRSEAAFDPTSEADGYVAQYGGMQVNDKGVRKDLEQALQQQAVLQETQRMLQRGAEARAREAAAVKGEIATDADKKAGIDRVASAYDNLHDQIARRQSQAQAELDNDGKLSEADRFRVDMLREIAEAQGKIGAASAARLRGEVEVAARIIANTELQREAAKVQQEADKAFADAQQQAIAARRQGLEAAARETAEIAQHNEALASETAEIGLNSSQIYERRQMQLQATIADKQARLERLLGLPAYEAEAKELERQIGLLQERAGLAATNFAKVSSEEEAKANQERTDAIAASIEEGVLNGFRDGRKASAAFLREIQAQFLRAALKLPIQVMAQAGNQVMSGLLNLVSGALGAAGAGAGNGNGGWSYGGTTYNNPSAYIPGGHSGGILGAGEASFMRSMPIAAFAGAPRHHSGMGPGELPAIIKNDEGVFTKGQMRAMAPVADLARAAGPAVTQNVTLHIDSRTDKAEIAALVARGMQAAQASLLDKMARKQV